MKRRRRVVYSPTFSPGLINLSPPAHTFIIMLRLGRSRLGQAAAPLWSRRPPRAVGAGQGATLLRRALSVDAQPLRLEPALESIISKFQASIKGRSSEIAKSKAIVDNFGMLQRVRVQKVLLVCSDYDSYTFEEEGLLNELVYQWYHEHSLSKPPVIDRVSSPELGIRQFKERNDYDMVIALSRMAASSNLTSEILRHSPGTPICLLALTPSELRSSVGLVDDSMRLNVNKRLLWERAHPEQQPPPEPSNTVYGRAGRPSSLNAQAGSVGADAWIWPFMWQGSPSLFTAMFKAVEDRINVASDAEYGVGTIMVVEDSVKFYSSFLPTLYSELWRQNAEIAGETMHMRERIMRLHSRPKVLFCTNYEEAMDVYDRYRDNMFGVITDLGFPREGTHNATAGLKFAAHVKELTPELPVLVQTSQPETSHYADAARSLGCKFVCKTSETLLQSLRDYLRDDLLFGPLKFRDGVTGEQIGAVSNVSELAKTWAELPLSSVGYHARHSHLSRWFFARAEFELAKRFRASQYPQDFIDATGRERPDWLRNWILSEVRAHRNKLASTVENVQAADATTPIVRLGSGSLGGKGRGFRFLHNLSDKINMSSVIPDVEIHVPRCFILATSVFDEFMESNALVTPTLNATTDAEVEALFAAAPLPPDAVATLQTFLESSSGPLAVRSSSLFEDAFMQPFAGIYSSCMLPNSDASPMEARLAELERAVKTVYASTFSREARGYAESMSNRTEEEKMAVILQPLVGSTDADGRYFYPTLAGVANSVDFYPLPHTSSIHGCAQIGLGLGSAVVDNAPAVHFSLGDPWTLTGYDESALTVTALDLHASAASAEKNLVAVDALVEQSLKTVPKASGVSLAPEAARTVPLVTDVHGERVVFKRGYGEVDETAAAAAASSSSPAAGLQSVPLPQILAGEVPLAKALSFLLRLGAAGLGCPVEIEFALKARTSADERHQLHLLQIRPQAKYSDALASGRFSYLPSAEYAAVASSRALGHGRFDGIRDVVYVSPERFDRARTAEIASEISALNAAMQAEGRKYMLMAPGRWGSKDAATGIPVKWRDIDSSAVIVETTLDSHVPVSQGSHFFQNIISFGLGYMTVDPSQPNQSELADYAYWDALPHHAAGGAPGKYVRHVRLPEPLEIVVDGQTRHGVVMKPGKAFEVYVSQVDAFMALAREQFSSTS